MEKKNLKFYWDEECWFVIDQLGWRYKADSNEIGERLMYFISREGDIESLRKFVADKRQTIVDILKYTDVKVGHYWGGDDSYWDFTAHIVGMGSEVFKQVVNDPTKIDLVGEKYTENFQYIFNKAEEYAKTEDGKALMKLPFEEKQLMLKRGNKLKRLVREENKTSDKEEKEV